jgi:hypothetical protein
LVHAGVSAFEAILPLQALGEPVDGSSTDTPVPAVGFGAVVQTKLLIAMESAGSEPFAIMRARHWLAPDSESHKK